MIIPAVIVNQSHVFSTENFEHFVFKINIKVKFYRGPFRVIFLSDSLSSPLLPCWFASNGH